MVRIADNHQKLRGDKGFFLSFWRDHGFAESLSQVAQRSRIQLQCRRRTFYPWVGKISWRRKWQPSPVFLPGRFHAQRSLEGFKSMGS